MNNKLISFRVSDSSSLIVFNNQLHHTHTKTIEHKLLDLTWKHSVFSWFLYKYKYFTLNQESCVYFDFWTYFWLFRVIFEII